MSASSRFRTVFSADFFHTLKRPMFWTMICIIAFLAWGMSTGNVRISSGAATVGGRRAWITSEFNVAFILSFVSAMLMGFFAAIAAGMAIIRDDETKVGEVLHATPLRPSEYAWGKVLSLVSVFLIGLFGASGLLMFFNHVVPHPGELEIYGPLVLSNYLRPAVIFGMPFLVFLIGSVFYLGERTRRPIVGFLVPVGFMLICGFFLWNWSPTWLDHSINRWLMFLDPSGFRWLNETWLKKDLGADFYNTAHIGLDSGFVASRLAWIGVGLLAMAATARRMEKKLRSSGELRPKRQWFWRRWLEARQDRRRAAAPGPATGDLVMSATPPGLFAGLSFFTKEEFGRLIREPAIYLFGIIILLQTLGTSLISTGPFGTLVLLTPGQLAISTVGPLSFMVCLLLMFFTAEALQREEAMGTLPLIYSGPARSFSLLAGKALGSSLVGVVMIVAVFLGCAIALAVQGTVPLSLTPFLLIWGFLLFPTFLLWTAFVTAVQAITGNRFATYGVALAVFATTAYGAIVGDLTWLTNWPLWGALRWSDMSLLELDRKALVLSRLLALAGTVFLLAVAVKFLKRRAFDATRVLHRLKPGAIARTAGSLLPWALAPAALGMTLYLGVAEGTGGEAADKAGKDYWKENLATWRDVENPSLIAVDLDLEIEPANRWLRSKGTFELLNETEETLRRFALTGGRHWQDTKWTLDGESYEPDDRSRLYVFETDEPLKPGDRTTVGFEFQGYYPDGISKNGGGAGTFILPSGVVLTSFSPSFIPLLGYQEGVGVDDDNRYEPKEFPDDFNEDRLKPFTGSPSPFTTRVRITAPADFTMNSVGVRTEESLEDGKKTVEWVSDHPVRFFNVVGGRWKVKEGNGTKLFYHPEHTYNVDEISRILDAARKHYSEWFYPYPWRELKISEFPALATYAQGFPTNITFSEGIGFLSKQDDKTDVVAMVTAHEIAHQWWANLLTPGQGPGGNLLSEGMSHFSTMMLAEEINGPRARMEFSKRIEERYGDRRRKDAEQGLVKIDGSRPGDTTVTYDKGGWVFWMTMDHLGREAMLAGLRQFIETYKDGPDYPVLQDFTATLRPFATEPQAFDRFVDQWYHQVVLPEFKIHEAKYEKIDSRDAEGPSNAWKISFEVENKGTGDVVVEIAAVKGERFNDDGEPREDYRQQVQEIRIAAGGREAVEIFAPFEPEKVVVDPNVRLLQLRRNRALAEL